MLNHIISFFVVKAFLFRGSTLVLNIISVMMVTNIYINLE
ncbi:hypothetical protein GGQ84_000347 [Desulfitispora alkaliphila]